MRYVTAIYGSSGVSSRTATVTTETQLLYVQSFRPYAWGTWTLIDQWNRLHVSGLSDGS